LKTYNWISKFGDISKDYFLINPSYTLNFNLPKTLPDKNFLWIFENYQSPFSQEVFIAKLTNARVVGSSDRGIAGPCVATSNGVILNDILSYWGDTQGNLKSKNWLKIKNDSIVLIAEKWGGTNYCHWILTCLPKLLLLLDRFPYIFLFIHNSTDTNYVKESFNLLSIDIRNVFSLSLTPNLECENLIVPSKIGFGVNVNRFAVSLIENYFSKYFISGTKRLYITRKNAHSRNIINENLVVDLLFSLGFEIVELELLNVLDQIKLFSQAEVIIAPHGAGLTNLVFCTPNTKVLEIFSSSYIGLCYWFLSNVKYIDYYFIVDRSNNSSNNINDCFIDGEKNIMVNMEDLKKILEIMEIY